MGISKGSKEALRKISWCVSEKLKPRMIYITNSNTLDMIKRYKKEHENDEISL